MCIRDSVGSATGEGHLNLWKRTAPSANDVLGLINFCGDTTGDPGAVIKGECDVAWDQGGDTSDHAGRLTFFTTPDNSSVAAERMRITNAGLVGINRTDPDQRLNVNGNIEVNAYDSTNASGGYYTAKGLIIGNAYDAGKAGSVSDDRNSIVWNERGLDIDFATSDTLRVKIDYSGNFLVGRTNTITIASDPSNACFEQLTDNAMPLTIHCNQTNKRGLGVYYTSGGTPADFIRCQITTSPKFLVTGNGNTQNANNSYGSISEISLSNHEFSSTITNIIQVLIHINT